ncbi:hypothetical protein F4778DRAFT_407939 [Xylariomycetidae sp. FL2044]|nr:hypothetical protein F4778DRAFT_801985 [Xylariomycetidae sp. FL2044]KAH9883428.1 hypothetical protein F4778DRAFT_801948 [Xylariomycetidae sp. FL2044]KAH9883439.1 hypothetical protein F4778DRAFT_801936 [Xylariomycetidae sp. FL2044]KAH9884142.1 hypothetical protein F4778DRAFT_570274 [Xylariomycetidae sp. FL2044]KAH9888758.1 hypothetical protein F4778DRAFT_407939 [Xylariomycetidae sp. FL2044]
MSRHLLQRTLRLSSVNPHITIRQSIHITPFKMTTRNLNSNTISNITEKEKEITGNARPVKGGPTAQAQKHAGEPVSANAISDITEGEKKITGQDAPVHDGPAAYVQSIATNAAGGNGPHTGKLDSSTISSITAAEKELTSEDAPVAGGPTAQAQKHAGEPINSDNLHDITEGEKVITGGERVKGGPTATAQSELGKSRTGQ